MPKLVNYWIKTSLLIPSPDWNRPHLKSKLWIFICHNWGNALQKAAKRTCHTTENLRPLFSSMKRFLISLLKMLIQLKKFNSTDYQGWEIKRTILSADADLSSLKEVSGVSLLLWIGCHLKNISCLSVTNLIFDALTQTSLQSWNKRPYVHVCKSQFKYCLKM